MQRLAERPSHKVVQFPWEWIVPILLRWYINHAVPPARLLWFARLASAAPHWPTLIKRRSSLRVDLRVMQSLIFPFLHHDPLGPCSRFSLIFFALALDSDVLFHVILNLSFSSIIQVCLKEANPSQLTKLAVWSIQQSLYPS